MFIRTVKTKSKGITYEVQRLVESYKTADGKVRQRVIMNLGNIEKEIPKNRWKELATLLELRINGQNSFISYTEELESKADELYARNVYSKSKGEIEHSIEKSKNFDEIDINSIQLSEARQLGPEMAAKSMWDELHFEEILSTCGMTQNEISVAMSLIIGRLVGTRSELENHSWFQNRTALIEMTPSNIEGIGKDIFYTTGDVLYKNKDHIESALYQRETSLFSLERKLFLFDLTNTYFEGSAKANTLAHRGKSKEKRSDCPLVSMALMVDGNGFPVYSRVYEGNVGEPKTLQEVMQDISNRGEAFTSQPTFVMDRGIATADNLKYLKESHYKYILIERSDRACLYEEEYRLLKDGLSDGSAEDVGWSIVGKNNNVYLKRAPAEDIDVTRILAFSVDRESKELAMDTKKSERFKEDFKKLQSSVEKGSVKLIEKVNRRIGRMLEKYIGITAFYDISVEADSEDSTKIKSVTINDAKAKASRPILSGTYVIETNLTDLKAEEIWKSYTTLTKVEAAFRDLKSELGMRPIFHTNEERTKAHLFIGMLSYHLLVSIEYRLSLAGDNRSWNTIKKLLSTHQRATVSMMNRYGKNICIRISTTPEPQHIEVYKTLSVSDPFKKMK